VKLNLSSIITTLKDIRRYVFPIKKIVNKFSGISSLEQLKLFIQERSAHVTQTTLYGYLKTRIGTRYAMMFEDETFSNSINIAKWNIYTSCLSDCTLYTFSYLINKKNLKDDQSKNIFFSILDQEKENGLPEKIIENAKIEFKQKLKEINWDTFHAENPFKESGLALYKWSPISDELKILDKEIVLNSIKLKWNLVENEFKDLTKNLNFN
jgi:hypothetical protein